jgi:hypothetical protein
MQDTASRLARRLYTRRLPFVNWALPLRDVVIKQVEPQWVASIRDAVSTPADQGRQWDELDAYLGQPKVKTVGPCLIKVQFPVEKA